MNPTTNPISFGNPSSNISFGSAAAASAAPTLTGATPSAANTFLAPGSTAVPPPSSGTLAMPAATVSSAASIGAGAAASLTTTTATTASAAAAAAPQLNFSQLEEHINKWTMALEEQEKMFINQATQVNSWDKVLIVNNNKIVALNDAVQKVKNEQNALEYQLELIATQHSELEECIAPLHQELSKTQHIDIDKVQTYILAENLDAQLRQMSEDLKEVIEHLNAANKFKDMTDPMVKIGLILNAHMNSLQWIESTVGTVSTKIDDISQMYDSMRRSNERSIRLTYN